MIIRYLDPWGKGKQHHPKLPKAMSALLLHARSAKRTSLDNYTEISKPQAP